MTLNSRAVCDTGVVSKVKLVNWGVLFLGEWWIWDFRGYPMIWGWTSLLKGLGGQGALTVNPPGKGRAGVAKGEWLSIWQAGCVRKQTPSWHRLDTLTLEAGRW